MTTVFARRDVLWQHMAELTALLNVPLESVNPRQREAYGGRHSESEATMLQPEQVARLHATYEPVVRLFETMGDFLVLNHTTCATEPVRRLLALVASPQLGLARYVHGNPCEVAGANGNSSHIWAHSTFAIPDRDDDDGAKQVAAVDGDGGDDYYADNATAR